MPLKLTNNAVSRLSASLSTSATSLSVMPGDGAKFPALAAGDWFPLTIVKSDGTLEIVKCTARSGDTLTITRAQEGTQALLFAPGDRVELRITAESLSNASVALAAKLSTARSINVNLAANGSGDIFDGSKDILIGVTGALGLHNGGTGAVNASDARANLGLALQATPYANSGVMSVGAFGLGGRNISAENVATTINDFSTNFKAYNTSTAGAPDTASGTIINVGFPTDSYGTQIILSLAGRMFFRAGNYASASMLEVYSTGNVTATGKSLLSASTPAAGRAALEVVSLGVDQAINDLSTVRSPGVTYTNTSGKPIWVTVLRNAVYKSLPLQLFVSGGLVDWSGVVVGTYAQYDCVQAIVPPGASYSVTSDTGIAAWRELR